MKSHLARTALLVHLAALPLSSHAGEADELCASIGRRLSSVSVKSCKLAGLGSARPATSVNGLPLLSRDVFHSLPSTVASTSGIARPPRIMLIGGIHGDELASVSIIFRWLPSIQGSAGRGIQWRVIPLANPDGLLATPPSRTNAHGVDLNRNFASADWNTDALRYWTEQAQRDPRRNPGSEAASEPETRWLQDEIADFRPDAIVAIHAPYGVLDFDGPSGHPPKRFGHLRLTRLGVYPGSLGNYSGVDRSTPVVTLEFPAARSMPSNQELNKVWSDMLKWIRQNVPPRA